MSAKIPDEVQVIEPPRPGKRRLNPWAGSSFRNAADTGFDWSFFTYCELRHVVLVPIQAAVYRDFATARSRC
jgi:hypothetical protein